MKKILFTGGGSAGHVVPNIALMEDLLIQGNVDVCYMGTDGIEKRIIGERKLPFYQIDCPKLIRHGGFAGLKNNLQIPSAFVKAEEQAAEGLRAFQPDAVFSKGGYVALPVVYAAHKMGIPCFCHESDFSLGLANRLSAGKCKTVFTSFPETAKRIKNGKYSGAPMRSSLFRMTKVAARRRLGIPLHAKAVLVFGGGSGSKVINDALRAHIQELVKSFFVLHVCGKGNMIDCNLKNYRQFEFVADMGALYAAADLVVSRAGSGTVFEILALKKPAVLIPLEGQTRGDQLENARYFAEKGLCTILRQNELFSLPNVLQTAMHDTALKERLLSSQFISGNPAILREINLYLS
ncbi:MAG: UDP-N-acetylglucosamine--N-acetylmuramyl-(pentapeptide) pyrophosphoryl-undecaprenol N-acetylglucosamine transferase [Clostridia bacterium]|nr:UDP-N-acetylglucosamine--N-acetylmuramyl-(pentapeptide) pyrophosphoryl-undecaprenol N-acetylglucosamine transferase [Clostridia bacterium]